jgi:hypothetical protein
MCAKTRVATLITLSFVIASPALATPPAGRVSMAPDIAAVQRRATGMYGPGIRSTLVGKRVDGRGAKGWTYFRSACPTATCGRTIQLAAVRRGQNGKLEIVSTSGSFLGTHLKLPGIPAGTKLPSLGWDLK